MTDASPPSPSPLGARITLAVIGALAGIAVWALIDWLPDVISNDRLMLTLVAGGLGFFAVLLALVGPARPLSATLGALAIALPMTGLLVWASLRHTRIEDFLDHGHAVVAFGLVLLIATPFVAAALEARDGWRRYDRLFDISWTIVVRYVAAWLFVGVAWAVVFLSNELFQLVGLRVIEDLLDIDAVPYVFSGLMLGLALSVVYELREYVSPFLILKLLHLLLPVALLVIVIFVVALPLRGLGDMFGNLSAASVLMAVTFGGLTLVTTAIDKADDVAIEAAWMRRVAQGLAVVVPVTGGLALYSVSLRVAQYGWTPDRLAAGFGAAVVLIYAVFYAVAVLMRRRWMARIRAANLGLALGVMGLAALWLTPVIHPERIATASQLARYEAGRADADTLAIWEMSREWGKAGQAGIARLRAMEDRPDHIAILARIDAAAKADLRWQYERGHTPPDRVVKRAELQSLLAVRPEGQTLPYGAMDGLSDWMLDQMLKGCRATLPDARPGCVLVFGDFGRGEIGRTKRAIALLHLGQPTAFALRDGKLSVAGEVVGGIGTTDARLIEQVLDGAYEVGPVRTNALHVEGMQFIIDN